MLELGAMGETPGAAPLSTADFKRISAFVEGRCGIRLPPAKKTLVESRLRRRVHELGMRGFTEYFDHVLGGGAADEVVYLVDHLTTNKTDFFREPQHFALLVERLLPALAERDGAGERRELRLWSAGCSTGEEPYTLAMVLLEAAEHPRFQILATDLSTRVLHLAEAGEYLDAAVQPVPLELRRKYLLRSVNDRSVVRASRALRSKVQFRHLNLLDRDYRIGPPMDVIFCRNVFIYFERKTQEEILRRFAHNLAPEGFLLLGHSESINGLDVPFDPIAPSAYRRQR